MRPILGALAGLTLVAACDLPTEAPQVEQRWIIPVKETIIAVDEFLPDEVRSSGGAFSLQLSAFSAGRSLGELCPACVPLQGQTAPVPAFQGAVEATQGLPADVAQATLSSGAFDVVVENGLSFDPLAGGGDLTLTISDLAGGRTLGQTVIPGPLPPGGRAARTLTLAPGALGPTLSVRAQVRSPGGQTAAIETGQRLMVRVNPAPLLVTEVRVNVSNRQVNLDPVDLKVEDIDATVLDKIQAGGAIVDVTNPFGVTLSMTLDIQHPAGKISKTVSLSGAPTSTVTLTYTGAELRSFLGKPGVRLTGTGTVGAAAGVLTFRPQQEVRLKPRLDLTVRIGG